MSTTASVVVTTPPHTYTCGPISMRPYNYAAVAKFADSAGCVWVLFQDGQWRYLEYHDYDGISHFVFYDGRLISVGPAWVRPGNEGVLIEDGVRYQHKQEWVCKSPACQGRKLTSEETKCFWCGEPKA